MLWYAVKQSPFGTLKRVSGKLIEMWTGREPAASTPMPRLLVVDDEESICFSMSEYFSLQGYKVDTARDLDEAEKLIEGTDYKVVIQDLRLGITRNPDGLEIIRLVRGQNPRTLKKTQAFVAGCPGYTRTHRVASKAIRATSLNFAVSELTSYLPVLPNHLAAASENHVKELLPL